MVTTHEKRVLERPSLTITTLAMRVDHAEINASPGN